MFQITSIDFALEIKEVVNSSIETEETLLDSDIVIINPAGISKVLDSKISPKDESNIGYGSFKKYNTRMAALAKVINTLLFQGKIIICLLNPVKKYFSVSTYHSKVELSNYNFLPYDIRTIPEMLLKT